MSDSYDLQAPGEFPDDFIAKRPPRSTKLERFMRVHAGRVITAQRAAQDAIVAIERMEWGKARTLLAYAAYEAQDVAQADDMHRDKWAVIAEIVSILGDPIHSPIGGVMPHDLVVTEISVRLRLPKDRAVKLFHEWWDKHRADYPAKALEGGDDQEAIAPPSQRELPAPSISEEAAD
jgi:hypothetical protein